MLDNNTFLLKQMATNWVCLFLPDICKSDGVLRMVKKAATQEWTPTQPLCEDIHLERFTPLEDAHASLEFNAQKRLDLTPQQEVFMKIRRKY